jgi:putative FmdB family regulatory protein
MAFYTYKCDNRFCGNEFTFQGKMSEHTSEKHECTHCNGGVLEQVLYPVAIKFNGSGFYVNDYKAKTNNLTKDSE